MAEHAKKVHYCPPLPSGWTAKFTGPAYRGESPQKARQAWYAFLREQKKLIPCPSQAGKPGKGKGK